LTLILVAALVEATWFESLAFVLHRYGGLALVALLVGSLSLLIALLDATPPGNPYGRSSR
jgi:hypothetical protein